MVDETIHKKIDAFIEELAEEGVDDVVFAAASSDGFMAVKYSGEPRSILYLVRTLDLNIMFDSIQEMVVEFGNDGRENNS